MTPVIVVPGPWGKEDLRYHAQQVAAMVTNNASFNCNAAKVLVVAKDWLQRKTFLSMVDEALAEVPTRRAYYPGALSRYRDFLHRYPQAKVVGIHPAIPADEPGALLEAAAREGVVPWTVIHEVPAKLGEYALRNEAFCGVLAVVSLDVDELEVSALSPSELAREDAPPPEATVRDVNLVVNEAEKRGWTGGGGSFAARFMLAATKFANELCWGTLSVNVIVHPTTAEEDESAYRTMLRDLRYGAIGVNCWSALAYALGVTTWGAFPGHEPKDIESGVGVVHNAYLFQHAQKSIVYAPFRMRPKPVWFANHKTLDRVGARLVEYERDPSWGRLLGVALAALRG